LNRKEMLGYLLRVAEPVLRAGAADRLKECLPYVNENRKQFTCFEAVGRLIMGMAPWLTAEVTDPVEKRLQKEYTVLCQQTIRNQLDPKAADYADLKTLNWTGSQILVDMAFLIQGVFRGKKALWDPMDWEGKSLFVEAMKECRPILEDGCNNWILFRAYVEAGIYLAEGKCNLEIAEALIRKADGWYAGDGFYKDGEMFAMDYYNSYVILPMLCEITEILDSAWQHTVPADVYWHHLRRYAQILERQIALDGTYIVVGRSASYRCGAFHALALAALRHKLPENLPPAQVRCALSAVIKRTLRDSSFDEKGFLKIGICRDQPALGEPYISTGSLYLCAGAFLPLGLPDADAFWTGEDLPWTQKRIWMGENVSCDQKIRD